MSTVGTGTHQAAILDVFPRSYRTQRERRVLLALAFDRELVGALRSCAWVGVVMGERVGGGGRVVEGLLRKRADYIGRWVG